MWVSIAILAALPVNFDEEKKAAPPPAGLPAPAGTPATAGVPHPAGFEEAVEALRREYPGPHAAARGGKELARKLLAWAGAWADPAQLAEARLLAAEALEGGGDEAEARKLRDLVRTEGPTPAHRARAALALGLSLLLRERYESAERYLKLVPELDPGSPWAARALRLRPYFAVLSIRALPPFSAEFSAPGAAKRSYGPKDLEGRVSILYFRSAAVTREAEHRGELERIAARLKSRRGEAPLVLLVDLDPGKEAGPPTPVPAGARWPVHRDGLGFEGPLCRALGIPRVPHFLAVGPDGKALYLGGDVAGMGKALLSPPRPKKN